MTKSPSGALTTTPDRRRWFLGSSERQTSHSHPTTGTPRLVPVPVRISSGRELSSTSDKGATGELSLRWCCPGQGLTSPDWLQTTRVRYGNSTATECPASPIPALDAGKTETDRTDIAAVWRRSAVRVRKRLGSKRLRVSTVFQRTAPLY